MTKTYTEAQLKLAREVMGNFEATCFAGYWVALIWVGAERRDELDNPREMQLNAEDDPAIPHVITDADVCKAFERVLAGEVPVNRDLVRTIRDMWESEEYLGDWGPGGDFETDDVLVQVAALGEVVYG